MLAEQSLRDANLERSLAQLQEQVRDDPSEVKYRVFLFQLLSVMGQWERALTQLNVAGDLDASTLPMVQTYREALSCEVFRAAVFAGERSPLVFGDPPAWMALMLDALRLTAEEKHVQAQVLREQAFDAAPATSGSIDEKPFEWIADADARLGPILEAIVNGRYYWIPLLRVREIRMDEPEDLRDAVWMPAEFVWQNGGETVGLIPTRYPSSETSEDDLIALGRKTEWLERDAGFYQGLGQRVLATDTEEFALMDVRRIQLDGAESDGDADNG